MVLFLWNGFGNMVLSVWFFLLLILSLEVDDLFVLWFGCGEKLFVIFFGLGVDELYIKFLLFCRWLVDFRFFGECLGWYELCGE